MGAHADSVHGRKLRWSVRAAVAAWATSHSGFSEGFAPAPPLTGGAFCRTTTSPVSGELVWWISGGALARKVSVVVVRPNVRRLRARGAAFLAWQYDLPPVVRGNRRGLLCVKNVTNVYIGGGHVSRATCCVFLGCHIGGIGRMLFASTSSCSDYENDARGPRL